jgi:hypothetical protein
MQPHHNADRSLPSLKEIALRLGGKVSGKQCWPLAQITRHRIGLCKSHSVTSILTASSCTALTAMIRLRAGTTSAASVGFLSGSRMADYHSLRNTITRMSGVSFYSKCVGLPTNSFLNVALTAIAGAGGWEASVAFLIAYPS